MRLPAILRTTAARLSALYLLLFGVSALVLVVYMTNLSQRVLISQIRQTVEEESLGLARAYERGGIPALVRSVTAKARQPGANLYLVSDMQGRPLAGNVEGLEPGVLEVIGWTERPFAYRRFGETPRAEGEGTNGPAMRHKAIAEVIQLTNGMIVLVGRDLGEPEQFGRVVRRALTLALAVMGLGAFLIWFFVGRRALVRIDNISQASRRIMGGDMSGRLPVTGAGDEYDRLSEHLNAMLARIAVLNDGLKQVSDNIAHDLKTPLTRLRNRAEAALAGPRTDEQYRETLEATIAESDQLIRTFNAILMISRLEAGYSAEQTAEVDLAAIIADVVELYEPLAEEAGAELVTGAVRPVRIRGNRELIGQALSNIVDNAIKYATASGGPARVSVSLTTGAGGAVIGVADNGPGIPAEDRERATERFVRLEKSRSQPGSGLGLSLAKAVMLFHGGSLKLVGLEPGLRVEMRFPLKPGEG